MIAKYDKPPYQPRWLLQAQVFLLRHLRSAFNKQTVIVTTTGRKTGHKHAIPINYIPDGTAYLAVNIGGHSNWYLNALANPCVTLEVDGKTLEARGKCAGERPTGASTSLGRIRPSTPEPLPTLLRVIR